MCMCGMQHFVHQKNRHGPLKQCYTPTWSSYRTVSASRAVRGADIHIKQQRSVSAAHNICCCAHPLKCNCTRVRQLQPPPPPGRHAGQQSRAGAGAGVGGRASLAARPPPGPRCAAPLISLHTPRNTMCSANPAQPPAQRSGRSAPLPCWRVVMSIKWCWTKKNPVHHPGCSCSSMRLPLYLR